MEDTSKPDPPPPEAPRRQPEMLSYRPPSADPQPLRVWQVVFAGVLTAGAGVAGVFASFLLAYGTSSVWPFIAFGALLVVLIALAVWLHTRPRQRGFAFGIWTGLGLALLIEGVCFVVVAK